MKLHLNMRNLKFYFFTTFFTFFIISGLLLYNRSNSMDVIRSTECYDNPVRLADAPLVSVKDFGAKGDGITDDTAAFNKALKSANGKRVFVPKGTYIISETISVPSNAYLYGDGEVSTLKAGAGFPVGDDILKIYYGSNITIENIAIDGNSTVNNKAAGHSAKDGIHLLDVWYSSKININKCFFKNNIYVGIRLIGGNSSSNITNCSFNNIDCGVLALGSGDVTGLTIDNCKFDGHANSESISLFGTGHYSYITISNNTIKNKTLGHAIFCAHGKIDNITITGNMLLDNCVSIRLEGVNTATISGNYINCSNILKNSASSGKGIMAVNCSNITINGNIITKTTQQAVYVNACTSMNIFSNTITDAGYTSSDFHAMDIRGKCSGINIHDNQFARTDNKISNYSFVAHSTGSVTVTNNKFRNCSILIESDSANVSCSGNNATVKNLSKNSSVL